MAIAGTSGTEYPGFSAVYRPATTERALTDEELAYVGMWASEVAAGQPNPPILTLRDDGTVQPDPQLFERDHR